MLLVTLVVQRKNTSDLLQIGQLTLGSPSVMGILNVTPDSFSDGGKFRDMSLAIRHAEKMASDGAELIDVGGESTRPGADEVSEAEELDRVIPVIEQVTAAVGVPVSVDTSKPVVMREAVSAGAAMINDVMALKMPGAIEAAVDLGVPTCLMHMQGRPRTMQDKPSYENVTADVKDFLEQRVSACVTAGLPRDLLLIDPGFGFGKNRAQNIELLANLEQLRSLELPILVGISRKATIGELTGRPVEERVAGSISAAVISFLRGASIVRAHDVKDTVDALRIAEAVMEITND